MAAARDSDVLAELNDPSHPAVLRLIAEVAAHGARIGAKVSLCGDAAGDPRYTEALLTAGLRTLSVGPAALGRVKEAVARIDLRGRPGARRRLAMRKPLMWQLTRRFYTMFWINDPRARAND